MNRLDFVFRLVTLLGVVALPACTSPLGPDDEWQRRIGVIEIGGAQSSPVQVPEETVQQGVPFTITVVTFGSSSCVRADGAHVQVAGLMAQVTPYDLVAVTGVCTEDLRPRPREVMLRFDQVGEALVRVLGRTVLGAPAEHEVRIQVVSGDQDE
jgi:hypothetical protein